MDGRNENMAAQAAGGQAGTSPATESAPQSQHDRVSMIVEKALAELARWEEEKLHKERDEKLFYCP